MTAPRLIACLDVDRGRVVKGVRFANLQDQGDPAALAAAYEAQGADEIVLLDVSATVEDRPILLEVVRRTAGRLTTPLTVGGGIRSVDDADRLLRAGADKVSLNSAVLERPELAAELAARFGRQCVVVAIDARRTVPGGLAGGTRPSDTLVGAGGPSWEVVSHGGRRGTGRDVATWARDAVAAGAGEVLLTSIDRDGGRSGYDLDLVRAVRARVDVPIVASGGAGHVDHLEEALSAGADAVLLAGILHDGTTTIGELKRELRRRGIAVRPIEEEAW